MPCLSWFDAQPRLRIPARIYPPLARFCMPKAWLDHPSIHFLCLNKWNLSWNLWNHTSQTVSLPKKSKTWQKSTPYQGDSVVSSDDFPVMFGYVFGYPMIWWCSTAPAGNCSPCAWVWKAQGCWEPQWEIARWIEYLRKQRDLVWSGFGNGDFTNNEWGVNQSTGTKRPKQKISENRIGLTNKWQSLTTKKYQKMTNISDTVSVWRCLWLYLEVMNHHKIPFSVLLIEIVSSKYN